MDEEECKRRGGRITDGYCVALIPNRNIEVGVSKGKIMIRDYSNKKSCFGEINGDGERITIKGDDNFCKQILMDKDITQKAKELARL